MTTEAAERLARRYPKPRTPRWLVIGVLAVLAVIALVWFIGMALRQSSPPVSAEISTFDIVSDTEAEFVLTVQRPDPSVEVSCDVIAQATNHERVGEILDLRVPGTDEKLVDVSATIETFRRATSVSLVQCRPAD